MNFEASIHKICDIIAASDIPTVIFLNGEPNSGKTEFRKNVLKRLFPLDVKNCGLKPTACSS